MSAVDRFQCAVVVERPIEEVWAAWTTPRVMNSWFVRARFDARELAPGVRYHWEWEYGESEEGELQEVEPPHTLSFTFGPDAGVRVALRPTDVGTYVILEQTQAHARPEDRAEFAMGCMQGWTFYLTNLKSFLEHGTDLREKRHRDLPALVNV